MNCFKLNVVGFVAACVIGVNDLYAFSPAPEPRPKLSMCEAIKKATIYAKNKIEIEKYYLDRVWIAIPPEDSARKWIVSWCPDETNSEGKGWFIVVVDMNGQVSLPKAGVHWLDANK